MAAGRRTYNYRTINKRETSYGQFYVYGNAVRQAEVLPDEMPVRHPRRSRRASRQVIKNRNRAMKIDAAYAVFLAGAAVCAVLICMLYLNLQANVVSRSEHVTEMQKELADLTEANNTAYNAAADSVNMETVHDRAMNEMGMVYSSDGTVVEYNSPAEDYVVQYNDIPEDGILAKSSDISK